MAEHTFFKSPAGLIPADPTTQEWFAKLKMGGMVHGKLTMPRNVKFLRKFYVMLHTAYDNHDWPMIETQWGPAQCSFEQFRKYVIIKAGHFDMDATPQGKPRAVAASVSFANMDDAEFAEVYSSVLNVILMEFLDNWTDADMERAIEQILGFA
jgi:hypothetical protein